jgi:hypothetical protein
MKHEEEKYSFEKFRELHGNLPPGRKSETPDFLIVAGNETIGVEFTEVTNESSNVFSPAAKYALEDRIIRHAKAGMQKLRNIMLFVTIRFRDGLIINAKRVKKLGEEISQVVYERTLHLSEIEPLEHQVIVEDLPDELDLISFDVAPCLDEPEWHAIRQKGIEHLDIERIDRVISRKEEVVMTCRTKADRVYLVIVDGLGPRSWYHDFLQGQIRETSFDKVFLLRIMVNQLVELK